MRLSGRRPHDSSAIAACAKPLAYDALGASPASVVVEPKSQPLAARAGAARGLDPTWWRRGTAAVPAERLSRARSERVTTRGAAEP